MVSKISSRLVILYKSCFYGNNFPSKRNKNLPEKANKGGFVTYSGDLDPIYVHVKPTWFAASKFLAGSAIGFI